jgi:hypothetical protein
MTGCFGAGMSARGSIDNRARGLKAYSWHANQTRARADASAAAVGSRSCDLISGRCPGPLLECARADYKRVKFK